MSIISNESTKQDLYKKYLRYKSKKHGYRNLAINEVSSDEEGDNESINIFEESTPPRKSIKGP